MLRMKKTLAIATLLCTVTATSAIAGDDPWNGAEALDAVALENAYEIEEADHVDPVSLDLVSDLDNSLAGNDGVDPLDEGGFIPKPEGRAGSEKELACENQAVLCAAESVGTALACASTIISPFTGVGLIVAGETAAACAAGLATGGETCSAVNDVCDGIGDANFLTTQSQFVGTTASGTATKVCGVPDRVRKAYFWWDTHHQWGITVISKIKLYCGDGGSMTFGNNNGVSNGGWGSSCGREYQMQGFDVNYGALIDGAAPRCDKVTDTSTGDWVGTFRGGNGGTSTTLLCPEGKYMYGMRAYYDNGPNADVNYIHGFNLLCRP